MGKLIFNLTFTLPLQPTASLKNKKRKKISHRRMQQIEMGAETNVKCSRVLRRKEKSEENVLLLSNLLAIESKKMIETIEAFLKSLFYYLP